MKSYNDIKNEIIDNLERTEKILEQSDITIAEAEAIIEKMS